MSLLVALRPALLTGSFFAGGDLIAQLLLPRNNHDTDNLIKGQKEKSEMLDLRRLASMGTYGALIAHPAMTLWYRLLANNIKLNSAATTLIAHVTLDQALFAPTFLYVFPWGVGFLEGKKVDDIQQHLRENYFDILMSNYKVWPAVQLFNFYLVPLNYRVTTVNIVALGWNTFLSFAAHRKTVKLPINEEN